MAKFVLTAQLQLQAPTNVQQVTRQIQSQLNNVKVDVGVQGAASTNAALQKVNKNVKNVTNSADRMGKAFAVSVKRFAAFSIATRAVGLLTSGLGGAVSEAIDFQRQMVKVSQVTGKTMSQLKDLTKEITRLSTSLGVSSASLAEVSRTLSQAGLDAMDTKTALEALAKSTLAATFDDITQTAEGAVAIFNQFGKGAKALEGQLGAINAVAGQFAVEAGDLISVIRRTGGVFKAAGGDLNELIALFTSVRATTRESAESIATGLRTIFTRIQRPRTIQFLKELNIQLLDTEGKFVGPFEAVKRLSEALSNIQPGDIRFVQIAEQLGGFRQIGKVIPLLQQFAVAQDALNVAMGGTSSLSKDAATAQEALAVRITKVKEEFLALIRATTESPTFQIMANTALSLASALIKVADALKPLIPMLTLMAGIKVFSGLKSFAGGFMSRGTGATGPTGFATGGVVPGSGNRDTVPAMLTPGEFVIRKSSVKKIGADNLQKMNNGGKVANIHLKDGTVGGFFLIPSMGKNLDSGKSTGYIPDKDKRLTNASILPAGAVPAGDWKGQFAGMTGPAQQAMLLKHGMVTPLGGGMQNTAGQKFGANSKPYSKKGAHRDVNLDLDSASPEFISDVRRSAKPAKINMKARIFGSMKGMMLGSDRGTGEGEELSLTDKINNAVRREAEDGLRGAVKGILADESIKEVLSKVGNQFAPDASQLPKALKNLFTTEAGGAIDTIEGFVQEGLVAGLTGAKVGGKGKTFDFPNLAPHKDRLGELYGREGLDKLLMADAKRNAGSWGKIAAKALAHINKRGKFASIFDRVELMAKGGAVSDTVPAMLTPGEFVVNKKNAQRIGYGNLHRMNAKGYASGGVVGGPRKLQGGGIVGGVAAMAGLQMAAESMLEVAGASEETTSMFRDIISAGQSAIMLFAGLSMGIASYTARQEAARKKAEEAAAADAEKAAAAKEAAAAERQAANEGLKTMDIGKKAAEEQAAAAGDAGAAGGGAAAAGAAAAQVQAPEPEPTEKQKNLEAAETNLKDSKDKVAAAKTERDEANKGVKEAEKSLKGARTRDETKVREGVLAEAEGRQAEAQEKFKSADSERRTNENKRRSAQKAVDAEQEQIQADQDLADKTDVSRMAQPKKEKSMGDVMGEAERKRQEKAAAPTGEKAFEAPDEKEIEAGAKSRLETAKKASGIEERKAGNVEKQRKAEYDVSQEKNKQSKIQGHMADSQSRVNEIDKESRDLAQVGAAHTEKSIEAGKAGMAARDQENKHLEKQAELNQSAQHSENAVATAQKSNQIQSQKFAKAKMAGDEEGMQLAQRKMDANAHTIQQETANAQELRGQAVEQGKMAEEQGAIKEQKHSEMTQHREEAEAKGEEIRSLQGEKTSELKKQEHLGQEMEKSQGRLGEAEQVRDKANERGVELKEQEATMAGKAQVDARKKATIDQIAAQEGKAVPQAELGAAGQGMSKGLKKIEGDLGKTSKSYKEQDKFMKAYSKELQRGVKPQKAMGRALKQTNTATSKFGKAVGGARATAAKFSSGVRGAGHAAKKAAGATLGLVKRSAKYQAAIRKVEGPMKALGSKARGAGKKLLDMGKKAAKAKVGMGKLMAGLGALATAAVQAVAKFQQQKFDEALEGEDAAGAKAMAEDTGIGSMDFMDKAGGALSGAAMGAMMGSFLGPVGAAIGGVLGAIGGLVMAFMGAEKKRMERLKKVNALEMKISKKRQDKAMESMKEEGVSSKNVNDMNAAFAMTEKTINARDKKSGKFLQSEDQREKANKEAAAKQLEFAAMIGQSAGSMEELEANMAQLSSDTIGSSEAEMQAARAAFAAAEANRALAKANADILKVASAFDRAGAGVDNFLASMETGANTMDATVKTLEMARENIALGEKGGKAVQEARARTFDTLKRSGIAEDSELGQSLNRSFDGMQQAADFMGSMPQRLNAMSFEKGEGVETTRGKVEQELMAGVDPSSQLGKIISSNIENLTDEQLRQIAAGELDISDVLKGMGDQVSKLGDAALNAAKAIQAHESKMIQLTQKRVEAERNLIAAQKQAIDLQMEAAEIAAKHGGAAVTPEMRRESILEKANLSGGRLGLSAMRTGDAGELRARASEIRGRFGAQEIKGRGGGFMGARGVQDDQRGELEAELKGLVSITKQLIAEDEKALKILQQKNQLEKDSLEALIAGDMEKFFKQQEAVGAQAAIASGDSKMLGMFGQEAVAAAFQNIQKLESQGVQEIDGVSIANMKTAGASAALSGAGIQDDRMTALLAGQTAEEEALRSGIRDKAGALAGMGEVIKDIAEMKVQTAQMTIQKAQVTFQEELKGASTELDNNAAITKALGGLIYASRGIFVPKGTDTVPAMLTPGEFVVRRQSVQRGNNLQILRAMNNGAKTFSSGGRVQYLANGTPGSPEGTVGISTGIDPEVVNNLTTSLNRFNTSLAENISKLEKVKLNISLDPTNINVTLNGTSFLGKLKDDLKDELLQVVSDQIRNTKTNLAGEPQVKPGVLNT